MLRSRTISGELQKLQEQIRAYAIDYGLTFNEVIFEVCDYDTINILAAQGGFPTRYPHWRFGMDYDQLSKGFTYGLQKIYEMVINTDPCYAYLLNANHWVDQKTVMAHVYGHADFFKNNYWFRHTNRKMMDVMANHGTKIRRYMEKYGHEKVERFIDQVLSLENLLDVNMLFETTELQRHRSELDKLAKEEEGKEFEDDRSQALKSFIKSKNKREQRPGVEKDIDAVDFSSIPAMKKPARDIMGFLLMHAPLKEWESDIIGCLRDEAYYFLPQRLTKIMNEGWASYWHSTIMTQKALKASEIVDFADHHAGVMAMGKKQINPYKIGIELYRDIERRWDRGMFGKEFHDCDDLHTKHNWDKKLGLGREKIFEIRKTHNDITFIDEFFTQEFCEQAQLFTYKFNPRSGRFEIDTRDFLAIKSKVLGQLTNFGQPVIEIDNANFENRGELLLAHRHQGVDLDMAFAQDTMRNIYAIWKRPINLVTKFDDVESYFVFDGKELKSRTKV
jgi:stage V sporulation protein R